MRIALDDALGGPPLMGYGAGLASTLPILAIHIQELRNRVLDAWNSGSGVIDIRWLVTDQLGTPRIILDKTGALANVKRHDYLPFGEELFAGQGGRTTQQGYVADGVRQQFTSQERDNETGLDYMHARYFASVQGRFSSADSFGGSIENPQSLNRYAYVVNNPINLSDPTGHEAARSASTHWMNHTEGSLMLGGQSENLIAELAYQNKTDNWENPKDDGSGGEAGTPWPPGTHDLIIADALPGLSEWDLYCVQQGSREVDVDGDLIPRTLLPWEAYKHSMIPQGWTLEAAQKAQAGFVDRLIVDAQNAYAKGDVRSALKYFGMAIHPLMDAHSPSHKWAVYGLTGNVGYDVAMAYVHYKNESRQPTNTEMSSMRAEIREKFACVVSQKFYNQATSKYPFFSLR